MKKNGGYIKTKTSFCNTSPFTGLGQLGMWYAYALESEIEKWKTDSRNFTLGETTDKAALCYRPDGFAIRRIQTDGILLRVYNAETNRLIEDSTLPISVLGDRIEVISISDVANHLISKGGFRCEFAIKGATYIGYVLPGKKFCAAWTDEMQGIHFETELSKNPNAKIIRKLEPSA